MSFYCQNKCGHQDFSIDKWNEDYKKFSDAGLLDTEAANKALHPEMSPCIEQCFDCMAIVGQRQLQTKNL